MEKENELDLMNTMEDVSPYKKNNEVANLSFEFAPAINTYTEGLTNQKKFNLANQLFRSGTSIHANIREAQNAESKNDFIPKRKVAAKEGEETEGWLLICKHSPSYPAIGCLLDTLQSILKLLNKIIGSAKRK